MAQFDMRTMHRIFDTVSLCACGHGEHWDLILMLLEKAEDHDRGYFCDGLGAVVHWIDFAAKVLAKWNLLEHGTSIGSAWLASDGYTLLAWLREYGVESEDWPEGSTHSFGCPCGCEKVG